MGEGTEEYASSSAPGISQQGFSRYSVGEQGQPAAAGEEGSKALSVSQDNGTFSSHEQGSST